QKPAHKRITILEADFFSESGSDYVDSKPSSARSSLNSIDFFLINHLVGPGTTSSRLSTNDCLLVNKVDISKALMDARRSLIKKQSELREVSNLLNRDPIPTPNGFEEVYNPDYFGEYDGLPVLLVEIKKPGAMDDDLEGDQRRLPCMQKLMLDRLLAAGVEDPKVVGFLIRRRFMKAAINEGVPKVVGIHVEGHTARFYEMELKGPGIYLMQQYGTYHLPGRYSQLGHVVLYFETIMKTQSILNGIKAAIGQPPPSTFLEWIRLQMDSPALHMFL
ncbi:hypothetical protein BGX27_003955, partial [Mortierella sp. AM989]